MSDLHDCEKIGEYSCGDCVKNLRYSLRDANDEYAKLKEALKDEARLKHEAFDQRDKSDLQNDVLRAMNHHMMEALEKIAVIRMSETTGGAMSKSEFWAKEAIGAVKTLENHAEERMPLKRNHEGDGHLCIAAEDFPCLTCGRLSKWVEPSRNICGAWTQWGQCIALLPCPAHPEKAK